MPAVEVRNVSVDSVSLPYPLQGVLQGGRAIVLAMSAATLLSSVPSMGRGFYIRDLPSYTGPTDDVEFGLSTVESETLTNKALNTCTLSSSLVCGSNDITGVGILTVQVIHGMATDLLLRPAPTGGEVGIQKADGVTYAIQSNATGLGFFGATPVARPAGVAVSGAGIHAALVSLGLISA